MRLNLQFLIRVNSNLSLKIVDNKSGDQYPRMDDREEKEVHFLRMEGVLADLDVSQSMWGFKKVIDKASPDPYAQVSDWTIVDFDDFLRGNPHI